MVAPDLWPAATACAFQTQPALISPGCVSLGSREHPQVGSLRCWDSCFSRSLWSLTVKSVPACDYFRLIVFQSSLLNACLLWGQCQVSVRALSAKPWEGTGSLGSPGTPDERQTCLLRTRYLCQRWCQGFQGQRRKVSHGGS